MKIKIEKAQGRVKISVQRTGDKKPVEVEISNNDAQALASLLNTAAIAQSLSMEFEKNG